MAVVSRMAENVAGAVAEIQAAGGIAIGVVCDIADPDQIKSAVEKVLAEYGRIDILVNNAFDPLSRLFVGSRSVGRAIAAQSGNGADCLSADDASLLPAP